MKNKKGVYICLEGLKGAGKTTVFELLVKKLEAENVDFTTVAPTKAASEDHVLEKLYKNYEVLKKNRLFRIFLYANRSNYAATQAKWDKPLILGERCIATSYATKRHGSPLTVWWNTKVIDTLERKIHAPDHILYVEVSHDVLRKRIETRNKARDIDDTPERLFAMEHVYKELMHEQPIRRMKQVEWHTISNEKALDVVVQEVYDKVRELVNGHNQLQEI